MAPRHRAGDRNRRGLTTRGGTPGHSDSDGVGTRRGGNSDNRRGSMAGEQATTFAVPKHKGLKGGVYYDAGSFHATGEH